MSRLRIFSDRDPSTPEIDTTDGGAIANILAHVGIQFERWNASVMLPDGAGQPEVLAAYAKEIARLKEQGGYQSVDVIRMHAAHPDKKTLREKFLNEHRHSEDEVRFFVEGDGLFCLHIGDKVYQVLCSRGDLINVPAGATHWFDMGDMPTFAAIRLFTNPDGWVAKFTGDPIAANFPKYGE